jgi:hypothetical protein
MSEEGRVIIRSPSLNPMKIAGSPHWHPAIQACLLPERRGIVALVRRLIWKKFPERPGAGVLVGEAPYAAFRSPDKGPSQAPPEPLPSPLGTKLFFRFFTELLRAAVSMVF